MLKFLHVGIFCLFPLLSIANEFYTIQGKIIADENIDVSGAPVVLLKYQFSKVQDSIPMFPIQKSQTNYLGEYIFHNIIADSESLYLIGTRINGERLSSEMIPLKGERILQLDIHLPQAFYIADQLSLKNHALVINSLESGIVVTEILTIENLTEENISSSKYSLEVNLPEQAEDFKYIPDKQKFVLANLNENTINFQFNLPPGKHQIFYEYSFFFRKNIFSWNYYFPENVNKSRVFYAQDLALKIENLLSTREEHKFGNRMFFSTVVPIAENRQLEFTITKTKLSLTIQYIILGLTVVFFLLTVIFSLLRMNK